MDKILNNDIQWLCVNTSTRLSVVLQRQVGNTERGLPAGIALVTDEKGILIGTITDGDVRRAVLRRGSLEVSAEDAMTSNPISFREGTSYSEILRKLPQELEKRGRRSKRFLGKIVLVDDAGCPTRVLDYHQLWEQRVATHRHIVVLGMGYVGLTLALELAEEGFRVTGIDVDPMKIANLTAGRSHVHEQGIHELLREQLKSNFSVSQKIPKDGDVFIISVSTPVGGFESGTPVPILNDLISASAMVGKVLTTGALVVLRSTVPMGATREVVLPILERESMLFGGRDFHLAFAPERTLEGKALQELRTLPQIIGGLNEDSVEATVALFRELTPTIVRVESLEAAELVKLINNAFRDYKFAFTNQIVRIASIFNIDVFDVIRAANNSYPRDPIPLPSPGVGGPCLTKDPYILSSIAEKANISKTLSIYARHVNESMHSFVADSLLNQLRTLGKDPAECSVLICGLAFKGQPETGDLRNSSSIEIAELLKGKVGQLYGYDPVASADDLQRYNIQFVDIPNGFKGIDAVMFLNNHLSFYKLDTFKMMRLLNDRGIVYDAWHLFRPHDIVSSCPCVYMSLGFIRSSVK